MVADIFTVVVSFIEHYNNNFFYMYLQQLALLAQDEILRITAMVRKQFHLSFIEPACILTVLESQKAPNSNSIFLPE